MGEEELSRQYVEYRFQAVEEKIDRQSTNLESFYAQVSSKLDGLTEEVITLRAENNFKSKFSGRWVAPSIVGLVVLVLGGVIQMLGLPAGV